MSLIRTLSRSSQLLQEPDGGNLLHGEYVTLPPICAAPPGSPIGAPARQGEFVDPNNPQLRLTNTPGTAFVDLGSDVLGDLSITLPNNSCGILTNGYLQAAALEAPNLYLSGVSPQISLQDDSGGGSSFQSTIGSDPPGNILLTPGSGKVGINVVSPNPPARALEIVDVASPQIRLTQAAGHYADFQAMSDGSLTITPSGGPTSFGGSVGIRVASGTPPARALEVVDANNPQLRLTNAAGLFVDLYAGPSGNLWLNPSSGKVGLNVTTTPNAALQVVSLVPAAVPTSPGKTADYAIYALGATGGDTNITGPGSVGQGGNGGRVLISGGTGGAATAAQQTATGGNGGTAGVFGGAGAASAVGGTGNNSGGSGATVTVQAGVGGAATGATTGTNTGGPGGSIVIASGAGGAANSGGTNPAGNGGNVSISCGNGGAGTTGGNGGAMILQGGAPGAGTPGTRGIISLQAGGGFVGLGTNNPAIHLQQTETTTLTAPVTDGYSASQRHAPTYSGAFTVTRHNYMDLLNPGLAASAVVTDAAAMRFDAAVGTHKALAAASTKATPGTVNGWLKLNVAGTLFYVPMYTSMTS